MKIEDILNFHKRFNSLSLEKQNIFIFTTLIQLLEVTVGNNNGETVNNLLKIYENKEEVK